MVDQSAGLWRAADPGWPVPNPIWRSYPVIPLT
jgi:hypothetical protein